MAAGKATLRSCWGGGFAVAMACPAMLMTGCANMATSVTGGTPLTQSVAITGKVHGGNQPVSFATVQIYAVGQTGVGSAGVLLATTLTAANTGSFSFSKQISGTYPNTGNSYVCPGVSTYLYLVARGGNTSGSSDSAINNSAAAFLAPLGLCSTVSNSQFVDISEVTTVAMVAALGQFINPSTEAIGNDGIGVAYQAVANAFNTVPNLVSLSTGLANTSVSLAGAVSGSMVSGVTVTATPESSKINTIANILSSCINQVSSTGSSCSTLFTNAVAPAATYTSQPTASYSTATDTIQAALYMLLNPTDGGATARNNLYSLSPGVGAPYQPALSVAPTDWTISIVYSSSSTCGSSSGFFSQPYDLAADLAGNIWIANAQSTNGALVEITAAGVPTTCQPLGGSSHGEVIDTAGNVWYGDSLFSNGAGFLYDYSPANNTFITYTCVAAPLAVAADGAGNIFFTTSTSGIGSVYLIANGAAATSASTPVQISNSVGANPARMFPDRNGNMWVVTGSNSVVEVQAAVSGSNLLNGYISTAYTVPSPSANVITGSNYNIYVTSQDANSTLTVLTPSGNSYTTLGGFPTAANAGGLNAPTGLWLDGAQNAWAINSVADTTSSLYSVSELGAGGAAVSANGAANGGFQKSLSSFNVGRGLLVDSAGNVWTTSDGNTNSITEMVGAAVPITQPYSYGLQNVVQGRFQTIP